MQKPGKVVIDNTRFIAVCTLILTVLMQSVYLIIGKWDITVLLGSLLGASVAVVNFFAMAMTVQSAVEKEPKDAKSVVKLSQSLRFLALIAVAAVGYAVPVFNALSVVIPYLFPRIAIALFPIFNKNKEGNE